MLDVGGCCCSSSNTDSRNCFAERVRHTIRIRHTYLTRNSAPLSPLAGIAWAMHVSSRPFSSDGQTSPGMRIFPLASRSDYPIDAPPNHNGRGKEQWKTYIPYFYSLSQSAALSCSEGLETGMVERDASALFGSPRSLSADAVHSRLGRTTVKDERDTSQESS